MPDTSARSAAATAAGPGRSSVRTAVVWDVLRAALAERATATGRTGLDVVDAGGGTGGFAVPLAVLGHRVTVVDPSPDSLFALERRAAEAGVTDRVRGVQGDTHTLAALVPAAGADVVLAHSVLEVVDDPAEALAAVRRALRPGGVASLLVANRAGAVLARVLSGRFADAAEVLADGPTGPAGRRFDLPALEVLVAGAGLDVVAVHGIRVFSDLVPGALLDDPAARETLVDLEAAVAERPEFRDIATQIHVLARAPYAGVPETQGA